VNDAFRQAMFLAASTPKKRVPGHSGRTDHPQPGEETKDDWRAGAVGPQANCRVTSTLEERQKTTTGAGNGTTDIRETRGNFILKVIDTKAPAMEL
jgi:hypothetical protein